MKLLFPKGFALLSLLLHFPKKKKKNVSILIIMLETRPRHLLPRAKSVVLAWDIDLIDKFACGVIVRSS